MVVWECNGNPQQEWVFTDDGLLTLANNTSPSSSLIELNPFVLMLIVLTFRFMPRRNINQEWRSSPNFWMQRWSEPGLESCLILDRWLTTCRIILSRTTWRSSFLIYTCYLLRCFWCMKRCARLLTPSIIDWGWFWVISQTPFRGENASIAGSPIIPAPKMVNFRDLQGGTRGFPIRPCALDDCDHVYMKTSISFLYSQLTVLNSVKLSEPACNLIKASFVMSVWRFTSLPPAEPIQHCSNRSIRIL